MIHPEPACDAHASSEAATESGAPSGHKPAALYLSAWNPPGYRKSWDRCSMMLAGAERFFKPYATERRGELVECVAWFDEGGDTKAIAGDFSGGSRIVISFGKRVNTTRFVRQDFPERPRPVTLQNAAQPEVVSEVCASGQAPGGQQ